VQILFEKNKIRIIKKKYKKHPLYTADGRTLRIIGHSSVCIGLDDYKVQHDFYVVEKLNHFAIFGIDFLQMTGCQIDLHKNCVAFNNGLTVLPLQTFDSSMALLTSSEHAYLPPHSEALLSVRLSGRAAERFSSTTAIIEPFIAAQQRGFLVARAFVNRPKNGQLPCRVLNPFNRPCTIPRGFAVATLSHAVLETDNEGKATQVQHSSRQLTTNLLHQGYANKTRQAQASSSRSSSSKRAKKFSGRLYSGGILQSAAFTQRTSDTGEHLDSACAQHKVPITLSEKVSYLRSKYFSFDICAVENDTFSEFIDLLYAYRDIFAYSETDIPECNLLKCHLITYLDAKPT